MPIKTILIPNIGNYTNVNVIEINKNIGDYIKKEDSLITLETDKASMEIPSPTSGIIKNIFLKIGDKVSRGTQILSLNNSEDFSSKIEKKNNIDINIIDIKVPNIGNYDKVEIIELHINKGNIIKKEDSLITLETEKATMEIPSKYNGKIIKVNVEIGDKVSEGDSIAKVEINKENKKNIEDIKEKKKNIEEHKEKKNNIEEYKENKNYKNEEYKKEIYASPSVRRLARTLNINMSLIKGKGKKGRITKNDCNDFIKQHNKSKTINKEEIKNKKENLKKHEIIYLTKINEISAKTLSKNWMEIPHVTFFDDSDITNLEKFRKEQKNISQKLDIKLTLLPFLIKAATTTLKCYPKFNSSFDKKNNTIIIKKYYNIGIAVNTPKGLVVPTIKNTDKKGILEIAKDLKELIYKSQKNKLKLSDIENGTFTISSLGILGTKYFTPIINMPEVAIIGVSKIKISAVWNGKEFKPRMLLPLSLSADHRVIDGSLAAQFLTKYCNVLSDLKESLL